VQIPHLDAQVIPGDHVATRVAQLHIADGADYFAEEAAIRWILGLLELFAVPVA